MRKAIAVAAVAGVIAGAAGSVGACTFSFSYESISAPIGTYGEIGIRVEKTHDRCVLPTMDDYVIEGQGIQILGETAWEEVGSDLYEKWVSVSLSTLGDGSLTISKFCTKEGYEEASLPIAVQASSDDGTWSTAWDGLYPFDAAAVETAIGPATLLEAAGASYIAVGAIQAEIPDADLLPDALPQTVRIYYTVTPEGPVALLVVADGLFIRFDHLI